MLHGAAAATAGGPSTQRRALPTPAERRSGNGGMRTFESCFERPVVLPQEPQHASTSERRERVGPPGVPERRQAAFSPSLSLVPARHQQQAQGPPTQHHHRDQPEYTRATHDLSRLRRQFRTTARARGARFAGGLERWVEIGSNYTPPGRIWSPRLEADVVSVMAVHAGMPLATAVAVAAAARSGGVSCNPGVLLSQTLRLAPLAAAMGGRRPLAQLLRASPSLLNADPGTLTTHYGSLAPVFGDAPFRAMLLKCPRLLTASPFTVWSNLAALSELTGAGDVAAAAVLATRQPRLLAHSPLALRGRLRRLTALLAVPPASARTLVRRQPSLLSYSPDALAANLAALSESLRVPPTVACRLAVRQPSLLMLSPESVRDKLASLARVLLTGGGATDESVDACAAAAGGGGRRRAESSKEAAAAAAAAAAHGSTGGAAAADAMRTAGPGTDAHAAVASAATATQLEEEAAAAAAAAAALAVRQPAVLTLSADTLAAKARALGPLLGVGSGAGRCYHTGYGGHGGSSGGRGRRGRGQQQALGALLAAQPSLLTLSLSSVEAKLSSLRAAAAVKPEWAAQLAAARPSALAGWLCFSAERHDRFRRVAEAAAAGASGAAATDAATADAAVAAAASLAAVSSPPAADGGRASGPGATADAQKVHSSLPVSGGLDKGIAQPTLPSLAKLLRMPDAQFLQLYC
ncbi:hypothetical protein FOA52_012480 [Chlamydomonas sp. UWO 241]|nr:hypothetical protein FOA52_012480 [Chlamydomonas sp. UWO 241]